MGAAADCPEPPGVCGAPISDPARSGQSSTHAGSETGAPGQFPSAARTAARPQAKRRPFISQGLNIPFRNFFQIIFMVWLIQ